MYEFLNGIDEGRYDVQLLGFFILVLLACSYLMKGLRK